MQELSQSTAPYLRFPALHADTITFVCDDDLWQVHSKGGVARRLTASWGTMNTVLAGLVGLHSDSRSVCSNRMLIVLALLTLVHWLNYKKLLSTWWRRIPEWSFAMLLGIAYAVAIFMKPVVFKAFIYFQF